MKIAVDPPVTLVIVLPSNKIFCLSFIKQLLTMYKHAFSGTGDGYGFSLENLDDPYSVLNIECMTDTCDGIKR